MGRGIIHMPCFALLAGVFNAFLIFKNVSDMHQLIV